MKILIGCEESQAVTIAFRKLGFEAYSCDLKPCSGGHPEWHIQMDVLSVVNGGCFPLGNPDFIIDEIIVYKWDLCVFHPTCTYLANSGVRWLYDSQKDINMDRWKKMEEAAHFFKKLMEVNCERIGIENPIIHKHAIKIIGKKPSQVIQPWQFGHGETKATCFWLKGLPNLVPTNIVEGRNPKMWLMAPTKDPEDRRMARSKTYTGIADAIASQWSEFIRSGFTEKTDF